MDPKSTDSTDNLSRRPLFWVAAGLILLAVAMVVIAMLAGISPDSAIRDAARFVGVEATPIVGALGTAVPTETPRATPTPTAMPTVTPTPPGSTPVAVQAAAGWSFEGVRIQPDPNLGGLTIYGQAFNDSGAPQRVLDLQSTLFDAQGGVLEKEQIDDYWPIEVAPAGWRMPFELTLLGPDRADRVELQIAAEPAQAPRTDFELSDVQGAMQADEFCVTGQVRNLGAPLDSYLMASAVLYDADDRVINWGTGFQPAATVNENGEISTIISACAESFNNSVARYDLLVWGE